MNFWLALVDGIIIGGAAGTVIASRLRDCAMKIPTAKNKAEPEKWEPFTPFGGICDELPEHKWSWVKPSNSEYMKWECPKCTSSATMPRDQTGQHQPPFCPKRGGHFHFKCAWCSYEWAMRPADFKEKTSESKDSKEKTE